MFAGIDKNPGYKTGRIHPKPLLLKYSGKYQGSDAGNRSAPGKGASM